MNARAANPANRLDPIPEHDSLNPPEVPPERSTARPRGILRPAGRPVTGLVVTTVVGLALIGAGFALRSNPMDLPIVAELNGIHAGVWGAIADGVYRGFEPVAAIALTVVLAAVVWGVSRSIRTAVAFGAIVALVWLPTALIKLLVDRPRPDLAALPNPPTHPQLDGSFPSGHTAFVTALSIALWFLLRDTHWAAAIAVAGVLATGLVATAVVSDGFHYPTDALASILWACAAAPTARWLVVDVLLARWRGREGAHRH